MALLSSTRQGVEALRFWLPRIWRQRRWDYTFFIQVMVDWLEWAEPFYRHEAMHEGSEDCADEMRCVTLQLRRIADDRCPLANYADGAEYCRWAINRWSRGKPQRETMEQAFHDIARWAQGWWD